MFFVYGQGLISCKNFKGNTKDVWLAGTKLTTQLFLIMKENSLFLKLSSNKLQLRVNQLAEVSLDILLNRKLLATTFWLEVAWYIFGKLCT